MWPNLFLIFYCPSSTAHDHFRTLSKWISVDIKFVSFWGGLFSHFPTLDTRCLFHFSVFFFRIFWSKLVTELSIVVEIYITWGARVTLRTWARHILAITKTLISVLYIEMFPNKQHALNKRKVKKYWSSKIIIIWLN